MPDRAYDFWLLDLDGTIVDVREPYISEVLDEVGDRIGCGFTDREAELVWHGVGDGRDRVFAEKGIDSGRFWDTFHAVDDPAARAEATYLYDDARAVADLTGPVGVVTHCQSSLTGPVLDALDIRDWFDTVVCCSTEIGWKPEPGPVELAVSDLPVGDGRRGAMAGDDPRDVRAAHNAGLDGVRVVRREHAAGETEHGESERRRVSRLTELPGWPS